MAVRASYHLRLSYIQKYFTMPPHFIQGSCGNLFNFHMNFLIKSVISPLFVMKRHFLALLCNSSQHLFLYVFRSLWSNLKNLSKCLKSRILTNLSDVVQLPSQHVPSSQTYLPDNPPLPYIHTFQNSINLFLKSQDCTIYIQLCQVTI